MNTTTNQLPRAANPYSRRPPTPLSMGERVSVLLLFSGLALWLSAVLSAAVPTPRPAPVRSPAAIDAPAAPRA